MKSAKLDKRKVKKLTKSELFMANCILVGAITSTNFKRPGNFSRIMFEPSQKELRRAVSSFRKKFPKENMIEGQDRLDHDKCEPAVLVIEESAKKLDVEYAVLLHPRDVYAAYAYGKYLRPHGPKSPKSDTFLVNSKGVSLGSNVGSYLRRLGEATKVEGLSFNRLRCLAETENVVQDADQNERAQVSSHLGHSEQIRDDHYLIRNRSTVVQAARRLHSLFEKAGVVEDNSVTKLGNELSGKEATADDGTSIDKDGEENLGRDPPSPDFGSNPPDFSSNMAAEENSDYDFDVSQLKVNQSCHISPSVHLT